MSDIAGGQFDAAGVADVSGGIATGVDANARLRLVLKETLDALTERRGERDDPFLARGFTDQFVYTIVRNYVVNPNDIPAALRQASAVVMDNPKLRGWVAEHYGPAALAPPAAEGVIAPFRELQASRSEPVRFGVRNTVLINTANLISNLTRFLRSARNGPRVEIVTGTTVRSFDELQSIGSDVVFNCTGLGGAVTGGPDPAATMTGVYGLLAKLPRIAGSFGRGAPRYLYSGFGYMFPRSDGTVIGGAWDESALWGKSEQAVEQIMTLGDAEREVYFSSLLQPGDRDRARAADMVRALGYFFLGRTDDLAAIAPRIGWFSGADRVGCAVDRAQCL